MPTFFSLTLKEAAEYRHNLFTQIHEIVFHGNGGYDWHTIYNMPIWLRNFTFKKIQEYHEAKNKAAQGTSTNDLNRAKEMYYEREINFFEYFIRRLQVYSELEAILFMKHYKGIDMEGYKSKLRKIFDGYPVVTKPGELDV